ncbi:MAG: imidazole glycerol phosphate synthase subunit HisH [Thermoleophilia bacterium]|nr:imidazole glycerol phosphate synthase subunit HisH [Thermoleophilia bacterium]
MVALLDFEMSNLRSAGKALERLGARVRIATRPEEAAGADAIVLPGVGRFGAAMERLESGGFAGMLREAAGAGVPVLGICLGLQVLFEDSEESPGVPGLGILKGRVRRLRTDMKVPHIGWSEVTWRDGAMLAPVGGAAGSRTYYFVHSYVCEPASAADVLGTAVHGTRFAAAAGHGCVMGLQFHPEKSSTAGLSLLGHWLDGVRSGRAVAA